MAECQSDSFAYLLLKSLTLRLFDGTFSMKRRHARVEIACRVIDVYLSTLVTAQGGLDVLIHVLSVMAWRLLMGGVELTYIPASKLLHAT